MERKPATGSEVGTNLPGSPRPGEPSLWQALAQTETLPHTQADLLESFLTHAAAPMVLLDRHFKCLWVNDAYATIVQKEVAHLFGHPHFNHCPLETQAAFREVLATKQPCKVPASLTGDNRRFEWGANCWEGKLIPLLDAAEEVQFLLLTLDDITQRRLAELSTKATNKLLRLFVKKPTRQAYLDAAVALLRDVSDCHHVGVRMRQPNDGIPYEATVGFDSEFLQSDRWLEIGRDECICTRVVTGQPLSVEASFLTQSGAFCCNDTNEFIHGLDEAALPAYRGVCVQKGFRSLAVIPIRHQEAIFGVVHLADERPGMFSSQLLEFLESASPLIGEAVHRFNIEDALRDSGERLRSLNLDLERRADQLRAMASELTLTEQRERRRLAQILHDHLQQLLVAAKIKVGILRRRDNVKDVDQSLGQIDDMLNESIRSSRSLTIDLSPPILFDAGLQPALEWLARQMRDKYGLGVAVDLKGVPAPLGEDAQILVFQAVRELLFNVVKHAGVEQARLHLIADDDQIRVVVEDTGVGFDPQQIEGSEPALDGLGLFSVKERLKFLGGQVRIESQPGYGTRAEITVPRQDAVRQARISGTICGHPSRLSASMPNASLSEEASRKIRVLVVDDHKILRQGLTGLLMEEPDLEVVGEAGDGLEAVEMAQKVHPDVILMDVTMPRLDGIEATARLTALLPQVRIIGLSMHEETDLAKAMCSAGAVAYLSKGGSSDLLINTIRNAFTTTGTVA